MPNLSQHDEKHVVPIPPSGIRIGKRGLVITVKGLLLFDG
jgi:hypothetical protein